jgi:hypothetical protein
MEGVCKLCRIVNLSASPYCSNKCQMLGLDMDMRMYTNPDTKCCECGKINPFMSCFVTVVRDEKLQTHTQFVCSPRCMETLRKSSVAKANQLGLKLIKHCAACGKLGTKLKCGRCKINGYCDTECQKRDWPAHKKSCLQ